MRIEDLLEFEGLTAEMVRAWLLAKGWERCPTLDLARAECWRLGEGARGTVWLGGTDKAVAKAVEQIARWSGLSVRSLLTEINPRMRPGWPTEEEIEAHEKRGGLWICDYGRGPCFGRFAEGERFEGNTIEMSRDALERLGAKFWPCDAHGNKVRRGTR